MQYFINIYTLVCNCLPLENVVEKIYGFRENPQDGIVNHDIISLYKNKFLGNQEVRFTVSNEYISNKLAKLLVHINTVTFHYT